MKRALPILAGLVFCAAVAVTAMRIVRNLDVPGQPYEERYGMQDFRDAFYYPSRALLDGVNPYDPVDYQARYPVARPTSPYAPHSLLLHVPFSLLPYRAAELAYDLLNLLLVVYLARACLVEVRDRASATGVLALATIVLLSRPTHQTLFLGQITCIVVTGVYLALLEEERRPWLAAAGVALACMKPTYGVPLVVALLFLGRFRTTLRGVLLAAAASLPALPLLVRAAGGPGALVSSVIGSYTGMGADQTVNAATSTIRLDAIAMIERLAGRPLEGFVSMAVSLVLLGAGSAAAARCARRAGNPGRLAAAGTVCLTMVVCIYHQAYDGMLLILPATALAVAPRGWTPGRRAAGLRYALLALLCVPAVNYLATDTFLGHLDAGPIQRLVITSLNGVALLAALVIVLAVAFAPAAGDVRPAGTRADTDRAGAVIRTTLAVLAFGLMTLVIAARIVHNLDVAGRPLEQQYGMQDYRDNVYYPSRAFLDGRNPYDFEDYRAHYPIARPLPPYTPIAFLVQAPYALLPYRLSQGVYVAMNLGLVLVLAALVARLARRDPTPATVFGIGALLLATRPVHQTLFLGQCALLVAVGVAVALLEARRRPWIGAAGLVLTALKPSFAGPLGILMLARGDARAALAGGGIAGALILLLSVPPAVAAGGPLAFLDSIRAGMARMGHDPSFAGASSVIRIDLGGLVGRFLPATPAAALGTMVALAVLGPAVWALLRLRRREEDADRTLSLGLACFAVLLCVYHQSYDAVLLALPTATLLARHPATSAVTAAGRLRWPLFGLLLLPAVNYLAADTVVGRLDPSRPVWLLITSANGLAIALAFVLWMAMAVRRPPAGTRAPRGAA